MQIIYTESSITSEETYATNSPELVYKIILRHKHTILGCFTLSETNVMEQMPTMFKTLALAEDYIENVLIPKLTEAGNVTVSFTSKIKKTKLP